VIQTKKIPFHTRWWRLFICDFTVYIRVWNMELMLFTLSIRC